jgi:hypothetical protein
MNHDIKILGPYLRVKKNDHFDRIEVSNIADRCFLGTSATVAYMMPLLQPCSVNPHATLITMYMNAVQEITTTLESEIDTRAEFLKLCKYMPETLRDVSKLDAAIQMIHPESVKFMNAGIYVRDLDRWFATYVLLFLSFFLLNLY